MLGVLLTPEPPALAGVRVGVLLRTGRLGFGILLGLAFALALAVASLPLLLLLPLRVRPLDRSFVVFRRWGPG